MAAERWVSPEASSKKTACFELCIETKGHIQPEGSNGSNQTGNDVKVDDIMCLLPGLGWYLVYLHSNFQYRDNRRAPCHSYVIYVLGGARSFDTPRTRTMDARVGPIVDIHDQAIIHELRCARISTVSPRPAVKRGGAPRRGLEFTRLHARVSESRLRPLALALVLHISAAAPTGFRRIIEIQGALPSDLSPEQRGGEIQLSPLSFPTWRGRPKGPPLRFSSKWTGCTRALKEVQPAEHLWQSRGNVHINDTCLSPAASQRAPTQTRRPGFNPPPTNICGSRHNSSIPLV